MTPLSRIRRGRSALAVGLVTAAITTIAVIALYDLSHANLGMPLDYDGAGLFHHLVAQRLTGGADILGVPSAATLEPLRLEGQPLNVGILAALAWASGDPILALNVFVLLAFPLAGVAAALAARACGLAAAPAVGVGVLFAFLPAHLVHALERPFVGALWGVPLAGYLAVITAQGRVVLGPRLPSGVRSLAAPAAIAILVGLSGWLVAVVGVVSVALASVLGAVGRGPRVLGSGIGLCLLMGLAVALTMGAGALQEPRVAGDGSPGPVEVVSNQRVGVDDLILPIDGHRIGQLGALRDAHAASDPVSDPSAALGVVGVAGLLVLAIGLIAAVGGGGSRIAAKLALLVAGLLLVFGDTGLLRALGSIAPALDRWTPAAAFIGFFTLIAVGRAATRALAWSDSRGLGTRMGTLVALGSMVAIGVFDQTSPIHAPAHGAISEEWMRDAALAGAMTDALGTGAAVYQMPVPLDLTAVSGQVADDQVRLALHDDGLSWHGRLVAGASAAPWEQVVAATPARFVPATLAALGFDALVAHRAGYGGADVGLESTIASLLPDGAVAVHDERVAVFDLVSYRAHLERAVGAAGMRRLANSVLEGGPLDLRDIEPRLERFAGGFVQPVGAEEMPDGSGRLAVLERGGLIWVVSRSGEVSSEPFLDFRPRVSTAGWEQGLLGLAFHPSFERNGRLFVQYTDRDDEVVVVELRAPAGALAVDPDTATEVLRVPKPGPFHNGGQLAFGPDGYLYAGFGDGVADFPDRGPAGTGQDSTTLLGSIARIDVDAEGVAAYAVPPENPFIDGPGLPEIWVSGLRNPWRFSFDRRTGDLYIGDVGQLGVEEVNVQQTGSGGGENFGWRVMAGSACFEVVCDPTPYVQPRYEYAHAEGRCAVTGGYVYRGDRSLMMDGHYVFGDLCTGQIWSFDTREDPPVAIERIDTALSLVSFGQRANGELLVVDYAGGTVYELDLGP